MDVLRDYEYQPLLEWNPGVYDYLSTAYGPSKFLEICESLTRPSINSSIRVNTLRTTTRAVTESIWRHVSLTSAASTNGECVEATYTQKLPPVDDIIDHCNDEILSQTGCTRQGSRYATGCRKFAFSSDDTQVPDLCWEHPELNDIVMVRGRGPRVVRYKDAEGVSPKEVVVSRKCAEAVLRGAHVFVPGVLACSAHVEKGDLVAVTVAIERPDGNGGWCIGLTRGTTLASEHAASQLEGSSRNQWFIGRGRAMMSRTTFFRESHGVAVEMIERIFDLPPFHGFLKGDIFLQNLPSIVAVRVLDPKPGERILDLCAAPGGKTTAVAILMQDKGEIIALDRSHNKVMDIKRLSEEMGLNCIQAYKLDALKAVQNDDDKTECTINLCVPPSLSGEEALVASITALESSVLESDAESCSNLEVRVGLSECVSTRKGPYKSNVQARKEARKTKNGSGRGQVSGRRAQDMKGFPPRSFDRVLLDAPCSALGLRPRLFAGEETLDSLRRHSIYQRRMIDQAVQLVRPGGILVYSTCTINPGENEAVVRYALDKYAFLALVPQVPKIGGPGLVGGLDVFDGSSFKEWMRTDEQHLVQRFNPSEPYDTIGFFIAKFAVRYK